MNAQILYNSPYRELGLLIKKRRIALGMSQTALAQAVGVHRHSVRTLENGMRMQVDYWEMVGYQRILKI